jgi:hypothetical protein
MGDELVNDVVNLIKEVGIYRLSTLDGCLCGGFEIKGIDVDIACGKGRTRGIWVWPAHNGDYQEEGDEAIRPIGDEVAKQVMEADERGPIPVHLRKWDRIKDIKDRGDGRIRNKINPTDRPEA